MAWLNYHHLYYFWMIAKEGGVTPACRKLRLSQPTLSSQLKQFERFLGKPLFERKSRKLVLTASGRLVFESAEKIFKTGEQLLGFLSTDTPQAWETLKAGVVSTLPRKDIYDFLQLSLTKPHVRVDAVFEPFDTLLQKLLMRDLDMVLSAKKAPAELRDLCSYSLDKSVFVFVVHKDHKTLRRRYPKCLENLPLYLPARNSYVRSEIDAFFKKNDLHVTLKAEIQDSELLRVIAASGDGIVAVEMSAVSDLVKAKELVVLGEIAEVVQDFYLISFEREKLTQSVKDVLKKFK